MREMVELRVVEEFASLIFRGDEGVRLGSTVRKVTIPLDDPRCERIAAVQVKVREEQGRSLFYGWRIVRRYSSKEVHRAELFAVAWAHTFEPAGEECGTWYDETTACQYAFASGVTRQVSGHEVRLPPYTCGVGARQVGPLVLDGRRLPRTRDFARTIAGERVVSERARRTLEAAGMTGVSFDPIRYRGLRPKLDQWYQLVVEGPRVALTAATIVGINPFELDVDGQYRCPYGHVAGLNLLSEVHVHSTQLRQCDFLETQEMIGVRTGLLRPEPVLLVAPRVRALVLEHNLRGWGFDVAYEESVTPTA